MNIEVEHCSVGGKYIIKDKLNDLLDILTYNELKDNVILLAALFSAAFLKNYS